MWENTARKLDHSVNQRTMTSNCRPTKPNYRRELQDAGSFRSNRTRLPTTADQTLKINMSRNAAIRTRLPTAEPRKAAREAIDWSDHRAEYSKLQGQIDALEVAVAQRKAQRAEKRAAKQAKSQGAIKLAEKRAAK